MKTNTLALLAIIALALFTAACGDESKDDEGSDGDSNTEDGDAEGTFLGSCAFSDNDRSACANYSATESFVTAEWAEETCQSNYEEGVWSANACAEENTNGSCSYLGAAGFTWEMFYYGMDASEAQTICTAGMGTWNE